MSIPDPIGPIYYDQPRAVKIAGKYVHDTEHPELPHSAVHSAINVMTETQTETDALLAQWRDIMQAASDKAAEIIAATKVVT